jgi:hypothetical protein
MGIENGVEQKKVSEIAIESFDGLWEYREIYQDGTEGDWQRTGVSTADLAESKRLRNSLKDIYGEEALKRQGGAN